jgi:hypothetical protein
MTSAGALLVYIKEIRRRARQHREFLDNSTITQYLIESIGRIQKWDSNVVKTSSTLALLLVMAGPAWSANDPGARAIQQQQLQRQQQQDQLQLEMQQSQRNLTNPPGDARQRQEIEQLELDQALRQQQLQTNQQRALQGRPEMPWDDRATRDARAQIEQQRARQESQQQLQQFDQELQSKAAADRMKNEGSTLPGVRRPGSLAPGP